MPQVGWCSRCNVPILDGHRCGICHGHTIKLKFTRAELKPIFAREKNLYREILAKNRLPSADLLPAGTVFYNIMGEIVIDGRKVFRISYDAELQDWKVRFFKSSPDKPYKLRGSDLKKIIRANIHTLRQKEKEALKFLRTAIHRYRNMPLAVSISGGKDSTASLALTRLLNKQFDAIFLNTTIEFDETVEYVHALTRLWNLKLVEVSPPHDFFHLCGELGPPSTIMKWCCKTQKFSPQNQLINERYPKGVLVVSGIRKKESNVRSRFSRIQINKMIPRQILAFPILDWSSLDVWLYLLWKGVPYNKMYDYGFARIGCWACPEKSLRDFKLVETVRPDLTERLHQILRTYATEAGLENPEAWIHTGRWRFRKTRWVKTPVCSSSQLCSASDQIVYTFADSSDINQVREFMKIFGRTRETGLVANITNPKIEITMVGRKMRVKLRNPNIFPVFERQLRRALNCVGCGACVGTCRVRALKIESGQIKIGSECTNCLQCVKSNGIRMSCISVNYKPQVFSIA